MSQRLFSFLLFLTSSWNAFAQTSADTQLYRNLSLKIRTQATYRIPMANGGDSFYDYSIIIDQPKWASPFVSDVPLSPEESTGRFYRHFWDKIFLKEGSKLKIAGEDLPLTCIFISGQDNRYAGDLSPLVPQFVMRVYLVANDWACVGPSNPGWPENGNKKETWETFVYFEIRDPTIMLPTENRVRFRWNEFAAVLVN